MADTICIVAFKVDRDRAIRYKKLPIEAGSSSPFPQPLVTTKWMKVADVLRIAYEADKADFVSIRFIREG